MISNTAASEKPVSSSRMEALLPARTGTTTNTQNSNKIKSKKLVSPAPNGQRQRSKSPMRQRPSPSPKDGRTTSPKRVVKNKDPSPKTTNARQQRRSFQGLGVVRGTKDKESGANGGSVDVDVDVSKVERMKIDRRRKSINMMRKSAQSDQIRQMLETTLDGCTSAGKNSGMSAEERLHAVLTKAKERGMSADSIFSFFNGGNPNTTQITKESFLKAIVKLGDSLVSITEDEIKQIVQKFDKNEDGKISIAEFKNYCYYEIPSVAWKAERTRLEKTGEMKMLKAQLSRRFKVSDESDENACGEEVFRTSKFFWKTNNNVEIRVFFTEVLNVITLQIYSQTLEKELPSIYVCRNKVAFQHTSYQEEVKQAVQKKNKQTTDLQEIEKEASWESISKYIVARLKLWELSESGGDRTGANIPIEECSHIPQDAAIIPFLSKLSDDAYDTLMIPKPLNLEPPAAIVCGNTISDNFEKKMESFCNASRKARSSRRSAQGMSNLVSSVLTEVQDTLLEEEEVEKHSK